MVGGVLYTTPDSGPTSWPSTPPRARRSGPIGSTRASAATSAAQRVARRRVLDRRQAGAHHPDDPRLPARLAGCQDRPARSRVRQERRRRPVSRTSTASAAGRRHQFDVAGGRRQERDRHRRRDGGRYGARSKENTRLHSRLRRPHRQTAVDVPHHSAAGRIRQRHMGERFVGVHRKRTVWSPFSADEELGYVYLPVESATGDYYGGHRPGNNLFAGSLVCLDARTGKRVWHHQLVHHDIWDYDLASPPTLINVTVNGKPIRAVAQATKWGFLFVFDRVNGNPSGRSKNVVSKRTVPGEWYSPTQPHPTKPAPYDRQGVVEQDLIDFTPELNAEARAMLKEYKIGPLYTPPIVAGTGGCAARCRFPPHRERRSGRARRGIPKRTCCMSRRSPTSRPRAATWGRPLRHELHRRRWWWRTGRGAPAGGRGAGPAHRRHRPAPGRAGRGRASGGGRWWRGGDGGGACRRCGPGASRGPWGMGPQGLRSSSRRMDESPLTT